jgi:phenylalanyl-tRNA synthetase alpha chain
MSLENLNEIIEECNKINKIHDLLLWKNKYLGQNSELINKMNEIKNMTFDDKRILGKLLNDQFKYLNEKFQEQKNIINNKKSSINLDLPVYINQSFRHIISQTIENIKLILINRGFNFVDYPEIETPFRCFRALNVPDYHPCQNNHQSFHLNNNKILRSHTTTMDTYILESNKYPMNCFTIGRTFRCDNDRTHTPMFHQLDMVSIGPKAHVKSLIETIKTVLFDIFEQKKEIRIRPSFFPFTEPSYEIDMWHNNEWLEIMGCGMLHPNVFKLCNSTIPHKAWALGMGIERLTMIKYGINDIRKLYE